jgi:hypothetical protein
MSLKRWVLSAVVRTLVGQRLATLRQAGDIGAEIGAAQAVILVLRRRRLRS